MLGIAFVGALAQNDQQRHIGNEQKDATIREADLMHNDLTRQMDQQQQAGAAEMNDAARKALHDSALFDATAGEYGGNSLDRARAVGNLQSSEQLATIANNARTGMGETGFRSVATMTSANNRLASIQMPSVLGTALKIGGAAATAYTGYQATVPRDTTLQPWDLSRTTRGSGD